MTDAINSNNRVKVPAQAPENRGQKPTQGNQNAAPSNSASAVVELSSEQLLAQMQQAPEVDANRIEAIKSAISSGQYKPDAEVIAQKFMEIEKLLP